MSHSMMWGGRIKPAIPTAAYGLRTIIEGYTGPLCRIHDPATTTEQDVFANVDGDFPISTVEALGWNNAKIVLLYDQGPNNADFGPRTTIANCPEITDGSGLVHLANGKATMNWTGNSCGIMGMDVNSDALSADKPWFEVVMVVEEPDTSGGNRRDYFWWGTGSGTNSRAILFNSTPSRLEYGGRRLNPNPFTVATQTVDRNTNLSLYGGASEYINGVYKLFQNNVLQGQNTSPSSGLSQNTTGVRPEIGNSPTSGGPHGLLGKVSEIQVFDYNIEAQRGATNVQIMNYYTI